MWIPGGLGESGTKILRTFAPLFTSSLVIFFMGDSRSSRIRCKSNFGHRAEEKGTRDQGILATRVHSRDVESTG